MSLENIPDAKNTIKVEQSSDVVKDNEEKTGLGQTVEDVVNYTEKSLAELVQCMEQLLNDPDKMKKNKEADAIKSTFYKKLQKEKIDSGLDVDTSDTDNDVSDEQEDLQETLSTENGLEHPLVAIENIFKEIYNKYKKERFEYNKRLEQEREDNLAKKKAVIEELKVLVDKQEDINKTFPEFREIQEKWRQIGRVPESEYRNINETYQYNVERFYDKVQINRELRDLDFKKNLEAKEEFCKKAEALAENDTIIEAFKELQKLHEQWKEYGPVAKEFRDSIWERFKAATSVINKKYQTYFEEQKKKQVENLEAKTLLCEKIEEIANKEDIKTSNEWNSLSKDIEEIQKEWRKIGFATKKENQKIYDRFRAACDKFFEKKRDFYNEFKDSMLVNMEKKLKLIEQAEALKVSTEWKKTTDLFINLQKQWKEIGAVPRKKSEVLWKRFRAACDEFFIERDKNVKPENDYQANLKAKKDLIEEINNFVLSSDSENNKTMKDFADRWLAIGFVPFKEKDKINEEYKSAMLAKFPNFSIKAIKGGVNNRNRGSKLSEKDKLVIKYNKLQQEIDTYENNMGFFSASSSSSPLITQMAKKIDDAKIELKALEEKIRTIEDNEENI